MSFRVQFTISDEEYKTLKTLAANEGFPNVPELCKSRALNQLNRRQNYGELYRELVQKIADRQSEEPFTLKDLIDTPPALLGVWLNRNVDNKSIPDVEYLGKDSSGTAQYRKIMRKPDSHEQGEPESNIPPEEILE